MSFRSGIRPGALVFAMLSVSFAASARAKEPSVTLVPGIGTHLGTAASNAGRIKVGQTWKWEFRPVCPQPGGGEIDDMVTFKVTISGGNVPAAPKVRVQPNPVQTYTVGAVVVTTSKRTPPSTYSINLTGNGTKPECQNYRAFLSLTVAPKLNRNRSQAWWFNGEQPDEGHYPTRITLTAVPAGQVSYQWTILDGGNYALFPNNSSTASTANNTIDVLTHDSPPEDGGNFHATVSVNAVASDPTALRIRTPHSLRLWCVADVNFNGGVGHPGWNSNIGYQIRDQFGRLLGNEPIASNEHFMSGIIPDDPTANWGFIGDQTPFNDPPPDLRDRFSVWVANPRFPPASQHPCDGPVGTMCLATGTRRIDHWTGRFLVGSATIGSGKSVQTHWWQRFQDHGRHCNVQSPPTDPVNPTACPIVNRRCPPPF